LVLGEAQILGQVRAAYTAAAGAKTTGKLFDKLFKQAIEVGRLVRNDTAIGAQSVSVSTAAVGLVGRIYDDLADLRVLLLGSGQMGSLAARYLCEKGVRDLTVASRQLSHAQDLALDLQTALPSGGQVQAVSMEGLSDHLHRCDVVISCTGAPGYVVGLADVQAARRHRHGRPLLVIDIALPRDVQPEVGELADVYLYDLDDLGQVMDENLKNRQGEAKKAEQIVVEQVDAFMTWLQAEQVTPTIKALNRKVAAYVDGERAKAAKTLAAKRGAPLSAAEEEVLKAMASGIVKKILHGPTMRLKAQAQDPDSYRYTEAARYLFGLDVNPQGRPHRCHVNPEQVCQVDAGKRCNVAKEKNCKR
jgi:glutamyl-tRNA reductase